MSVKKNVKKKEKNVKKRAVTKNIKKNVKKTANSNAKKTMKKNSVKKKLQRALKKKIKIGFFDFTGCEGCQTEILAQNYEFFKLLDDVEIVSMRLLKSTKKIPKMDVAFIEGAISSKKELPKLKEIRKQAEKVISIGSCATTGGYPKMRNNISPELKARIQPMIKKFKQIDVKPIHEHIKVEHLLHGCPPKGEEFIKLVIKLVNNEPIG